MAVKDNWNWSRSNLFFGLPFYHAGIKATYELSKSWTAELMICNGWNNIVDNNRQKSVDLSATYKASDTLSLHFLYFGGVERSTGAPEGEPWRHLFDAFATGMRPRRSLSSCTPTRASRTTTSGRATGRRSRVTSGSSSRASSFSRRGRTSSGSTWLRAPRARQAPSSGRAIASRPRRSPSTSARWTTSPFDWKGATTAARPRCISEARSAGDGSTAFPYVPNARSQNTITLGATSWF